MSDETEAPTRVEPGSRVGLRAQVAHGPRKQWDQIGEKTTVAVTLPVALVRWARESDLVLSRVLRDALDKLQGGSDLARIETELRSHQEQVRILEAARETLLEKKRAEDDATTRRAAFEAAVRELVSSPRNFRRIPRRANLVWAEAAIKRTPALRGAKPDEVLDLVLAALPPAEGT